MPSARLPEEPRNPVVVERTSFEQANSPPAAQSPAQPPVQPVAQPPAQPVAKPPVRPVAQLPANVRASEPEILLPPEGVSSQAKTGSLGPVNLPPPSDTQLITLHADNLEIPKALEILSRQVKINVIVSPGITGRITLDIQDKTLDETLTIIAKVCGLAIRRENNVIFVSTPKEVRQAEDSNLPVRIYHLNYVKSSDVLKMIKESEQPGGKIASSPDSQVGLMSGSAGGSGGRAAAVAAVAEEAAVAVAAAVAAVVAAVVAVVAAATRWPAAKSSSSRTTKTY